MFFSKRASLFLLAHIKIHTRTFFDQTVGGFFEKFQVGEGGVDGQPLRLLFFCPVEAIPPQKKNSASNIRARALVAFAL